VFVLVTIHYKFARLIHYKHLCCVRMSDMPAHTIEQVQKWFPGGGQLLVAKLVKHLADDSKLPIDDQIGMERMSKGALCLLLDDGSTVMHSIASLGLELACRQAIDWCKTNLTRCSFARVINGQTT